MSATQMAKSLGLTRDGIRYHLGRMKADGVIRFVGSTRNGNWEILASQPTTVVAPVQVKERGDE